MKFIILVLSILAYCISGITSQSCLRSHSYFDVPVQLDEYGVFIKQDNIGTEEYRQFYLGFQPQSYIPGNHGEDVPEVKQKVDECENNIQIPAVHNTTLCDFFHFEFSFWHTNLWNDKLASYIGFISLAHTENDEGNVCSTSIIQSLKSSKTDVTGVALIFGEKGDDGEKGSFGGRGYFRIYTEASFQGWQFGNLIETVPTSYDQSSLLISKWMISIPSIQIQDRVLILKDTKAIFSLDTYYTLLPNSIYDEILKNFVGSTSNNDFIYIPCGRENYWVNLMFGGVRISLRREDFELQKDGEFCPTMFKKSLSEIDYITFGKHFFRSYSVLYDVKTDKIGITYSLGGQIK